MSEEKVMEELHDRGMSKRKTCVEDFADERPETQRELYLKLIDYKFPHAQVVPLGIGPEEGPPDLGECIGVAKSGEGKEGVLFIELPDDRAVVVKAPSELANEVFGAYLCDRFRQHVKSPNWKIISVDSDEGQSAIDAIREAPRPAAQDAMVNDFFEGRTHILVYEYMPATSLGENNKGRNGNDEWVNTVFGSHTQGEFTCHEEGNKNLRRLGSLLAVDALLNNYDRLPCIWQNMGNTNNVMFMKNSGELISIDTAISAITSNAKLVYFETVADLVRELAAEPLSQSEAFTKIRTLLRDGDPKAGWPGIGIDIGEKGVEKMQEGFLNAVHHAVDGASQLDGGLREWIDEAYQEFVGIPEEWAEFVSGVLGAFKKGLSNARSLRTESSTEELPAEDSERAVRAESWLPEFNREESWIAVHSGVRTLRRMKPLDLTSHDGTPLRRLPSESRLDALERAHIRIDGASPVSVSSTSSGKAFKRTFSMKTTSVISMSGSVYASHGWSRDEPQPSVVPHNESRNLEDVEDSSPCPYWPLENLTCMSPWPEGVDPESREAYLSPEDFQKVFHTTLETFKTFPIWRQKELKKSAKLF